MSRVRQHFHFWVTGLAVLFLGCIFVLSAPQSAFAASTRTWDGEGTDGTCGGGVGDGNKWSCAANWSANTAPVAGDIATFNATSTKNATIDIAFSLLTLNMNAGYTGTITQAADLTIVSGAFTHNTADGRFLWSAGTLLLTGLAWQWDVDTGDDSFGNVNINLTSGTSMTVISGDTAVVAGTLTLTDGGFLVGTINAQGPIIHGVGFDGGTGTLNITAGATDINLTGGGAMPKTTLNTNRIMNGPVTGTVTFNGLFTVSAGTYTGGAGDLSLSAGLTVSGGTFTGGSGAIDVNSATGFVLSGVGTTFTATSGTMFVAGAWTHTDASVFTHNSGTVVFDSGTNATINVNTTETFNNVTWSPNPNEIWKTVSSGDTLIVEGTLTLVDGNIPTGTVEARGPVIHGALFDGGTGTLNITGTAVRTIDLIGGGQLPATVTLNAANVIMNGPTSGTVAFDGSFNVSNGTYTGGAGHITLAVSLTVSGGTFTGGAGDIAITGALSVTGGTFTGGSGAIDVNSTFNLSSPGAFTSTSGTLYVTNSWTHTDASVFAHNSGTVTFDGASSVTINVNTTETFNNVTWGPTAGVNKTVSTGDTLIVEGTLTLTDGNILTGTVEARGPVIHGALFDGGTGTLSITGTGVRTIDLTAGGQLPAIVTLNAANVIMNGPASGTVAFDGAFNVSNGTYTGGTGDITLTNLTVSGGTFTGGSGAIDCNSTFTLSSPGAFTSTSGTFYVSGAWTHTDASVFTHNSGTVTFDGVTATINVNSTETFNNVTWSTGSNDIWKTVSSGDTLIVEGTLTLTEGDIITGTVEARGPVVHSAGFDGGTGTLNITQGSTDINLIAGGQLPAVNLSANRIINGAASGTVTFDGNFGLTAGSFVGGAGNLDLNGTSTTLGLSIVSPASFTAPSGTMFIAGGFSHTDASVFTHNSGTVTFDVGTATINVNTTETFNNVTFNATPDFLKTVSVGDTLIVEGILTLTDGNIQTGTVETRGPVIHGALFDGGSGTLTITGTNMRTIDLTAGGQLPNVVLNAADVIMNGPTSGSVRFDGTFTVSGGNYTGGAGDVTITGVFSVTGGTFTGGSGAIDANSTFVLSSPGAFTSTSGTFYAANAWTHTDASVFTHNSGTVTFDGVLSTLNVNTTETFNNVTFATAVNKTVSSGDTLVVLGTLLLTDGFVNTGTLEARGGVVVSSTFDGGSATLKFSGSATQSFDLTGATGLYNGDITVNKSGGQVNLASALVMDAASQDLDIQEGKLSLAGNNLTVNGTSGTVVVEDGGILQLVGSETNTFNASNPSYQSGATTIYVGDGDALADTYIVTPPTAFHHLTFNATDGAVDVFELGSALDVNGTLTLTSGTLDASSSNYGITVAGDWVNAATFTPRQGTVTLDGTSQTISGTNTFYGLTKTDATGSSTLTFPAGVTTTVTGPLSLTSSLQYLYLRSSTPGVQAKLDPQSSRTLRGLDVMDSDNDNAVTTWCTVRCHNSGNNQNWILRWESGTNLPVSSSPAFVIDLTSPTTGATFTGGEIIDVTWDSSHLNSYSVQFSLSTDGGSTYAPILGPFPNTGSGSLSLPNADTSSVYLTATLTDLIETLATDSVGPLTITSTSATPSTPLTPSTPSTSSTSSISPVTAMSFMRLADFSTVYYIDANLVRHPIPSEQIYFTHALSWSQVSTASQADLIAETSLGSPLLPKAGTVLVKIVSTPEVYAITSSTDGQTTLHWIPSEEIAKSLYGQAWADYVIDIDVTLWSKFAFGTDMTGTESIDLTSMRKREELR